MLIYKFDNAPCPFCGGVDIAMKTIHNTDDAWEAYCECQHCAARGSNYSHVDSEEEAIQDASENWRNSCTISTFDKYVFYPLHRLAVWADQTIHEIFDD